MWLYLSLASVLTLAVAELFQKKSLSSEKDVPIFLNNFVVSIVLAIMGLFSGIIFFQFDKSTLHIENGWLLLLNGFIFFVACTVFYSSFKGISASLGNVLNSASVLFSTTWGILLLHESVTWQKFVGISLILLAIIFVNMKSEKGQVKYILMALAGGVLFSITYAIDKEIMVSSSLSPFFYLAISTTITALLNILFGYNVIFPTIKTYKWNDFSPMVVVAIAGGIFNVLTYFALKVGGEVGKIDAINNSVSVVILVGEYIFLHDRNNVAKRIGAILLVVSGIFFLA